jgi:hypothetical protein
MAPDFLREAVGVTGPARGAPEPAPSGDLPEDDHLPKNLPPRLRELIPVGAAIGLGVATLLLVRDIVVHGRGELGPTFWPSMLAWGAIGLGLLLVFTNVVRGARPSDIPEGMTRWGILRVLFTGLVLIGYLFLFNVLQFWLITMVTVAALTALYGIRNWKSLILFPVIIGAVLHLLFIVLLKVPL